MPRVAALRVKTDASAFGPVLPSDTETQAAPFKPPAPRADLRLALEGPPLGQALKNSLTKSPGRHLFAAARNKPEYAISQATNSDICKEIVLVKGY